MSSRRTFLGGIMAAIGGIIFRKSSADTMETKIRVEGERIKDQMAREIEEYPIMVGPPVEKEPNEDRELKAALNRIADNVHAARTKRRAKQRRSWVRDIQNAAVENKELMRYYGLTLDNIRALTVDQRSLLLDELEPRAPEGCKQTTFDDDYAEGNIYYPLDTADYELIAFVNKCRGLKDTKRRPRELNDSNGPSFLVIPVKTEDGRTVPEPRTYWSARLTERKTDEKA